MNEQALRKRANALYWDSDQSVNHIAETMDLSKGRLYELVSPLPSDWACGECSAMTHFANRTAKEKGNVVCPECGFQGPVGTMPDSGDTRAEPQPPAAHPAGPVDESSHELEYAGPPPDGRVATRVWVGAALLGAAVGLYAMTRRRR